MRTCTWYFPWRFLIEAIFSPVSVTGLWQELLPWELHQLNQWCSQGPASTHKPEVASSILAPATKPCVPLEELHFGHCTIICKLIKINISSNLFVTPVWQPKIYQWGGNYLFPSMRWVFRIFSWDYFRILNSILYL